MRWCMGSEKCWECDRAGFGWWRAGRVAHVRGTRVAPSIGAGAGAALGQLILVAALPPCMARLVIAVDDGRGWVERAHTCQAGRIPNIVVHAPEDFKYSIRQADDELQRSLWSVTLRTA
jgi:hypothetical protein